MYYTYPCNHFRQQAMAGMNANQMGAMPEMAQQMPAMQMPAMQMPAMQMQQMQPTMPMMPMMPMGQMDQVGVPPTAGAATPLGTTTGSLPTGIASVPLTGEEPVMSTDYTQGYLKTQIGRRVKVEFLIGTNMLVDREGTLVDVGISYIIINEVETDDLLLCDIYSIKFVRFYF